MAYDSAISSFTTKTDKVDLVAAAHINTVQSEIVVIETILGTNVKGNRSDLKTRLNNALDGDGSILSGTSFPSPALASQAFYRTDLDSFYLRNAANSAWNQLGSSLSNSVFEWFGKAQGATNQLLLSNSTDPSAASVTAADFQFIKVTTTSYEQILAGKFTKVSGISTLTLQALVNIESTGADKYIRVKADVGGQNNNVLFDSSTTPTWGTAVTIDISGLTNGTTYDIAISALIGPSSAAGGVFAVQLIGS